MLIDAHVHISRDGKWFDTMHDASIARALREMDAANVAKAALIAQPGNTFREESLELVSRYNDRFFTGFTISDTSDEELSQLQMLIDEAAIKFIKVHPRSTGIIPLDPKLSPFLKLAQERKMAVVFCSYMRGGRLQMKDLQPLIYDELARLYPELPIIIAHAGTYRALDALAVAQSHKNVYLELSHVLQYFQGSSVENDLAFIIKKLDQKLIFGSDFPEYSIDKYVKTAQDLINAVKPEALENIMGRLAARVFNL